MRKLKLLAQAFVTLLLLTALCGPVAKAQTKIVALPGNNIIYRGNAASQSYYISFPAGTTHVGVDFSSFAATPINASFFWSVGTADPQAIGSFGAANVGNMACTINPATNVPSTPVQSNLVVISGISAEVFFDCPMPGTGNAFLQITSTTITAQWSISIIAFQGPNASMISGFLDPCLSNQIPKNSSVINVSAAGTSGLVGASNQQVVYVCGFSFTINQTVAVNNVQFIYGTGATCGTNTQTVTVTYGSGGPTVGPPIVITQNVPITAGFISSGLCIVVGGTTPNIQGVVTYVKF
jgi:hypothetical protein